VEFDPKHGNWYRYRANAYREKGEYDNVVADYTQTMAHGEKDAVIYRDRGIAYGHCVTVNGCKEMLGNALADFNWALELDPEDSPAYINRALVYMYQDNYDDAIADCNRALEIDSQLAMAYLNRGAARFYKGISHYHMGNYDRAIADMGLVLKSKRYEVFAHNWRGLVYLKKEDYDRALADFYEAVRLDPDFTAGYQNRIFVYTKRIEKYSALAAADSLAIANSGQGLKQSGQWTVIEEWQ
jgi:tetratricopeptide (TPR) repeat protein